MGQDREHEAGDGVLAEVGRHVPHPQRSVGRAVAIVGPGEGSQWLGVPLRPALGLGQQVIAGMLRVVVEQVQVVAVAGGGAGVEFRGLAERLGRLLVAAQVAIGGGQLVPEAGVARVQLQRLAVQGDRAGGPAELPPAGGLAAVGLGVAGAEGGGPGVGVGRLGELVQAGQGHPQVLPRLGVVVAEADGLAEPLDGLGVPPEPAEQRAEVAAEGGGRGVQPRRPLQEWQGLARPAGLLEQHPQEVQGVGVVGVMREHPVVDSLGLAVAAAAVDGECGREVVKLSRQVAFDLRWVRNGAGGGVHPLHHEWEPRRVRGGLP